MDTKLAGHLAKGDRIVWDGQPATVTAIAPFETPRGSYVEFIVRGEDFHAATVLESGDAVRLAPVAGL